MGQKIESAVHRIEHHHDVHEKQKQKERLEDVSKKIAKTDKEKSKKRERLQNKEAMYKVADALELLEYLPNGLMKELDKLFDEKDKQEQTQKMLRFSILCQEYFEVFGVLDDLTPPILAGDEPLVNDLLQGESQSIMNKMQHNLDVYEEVKGRGVTEEKLAEVRQAGRGFSHLEIGYNSVRYEAPVYVQGNRMRKIELG